MCKGPVGKSGRPVWLEHKRMEEPERWSRHPVGTGELWKCFVQEGLTCLVLE